MTAIPEGWRQIARLSPFNALVGPLYQRSAGEALSIGETARGFVTVQLSIDYALADGVRMVRASAIFARSEKE